MKTDEKLQKNRVNIINSEYDECVVFFKWAQFNPIAKKYLYHTVNEGKRTLAIGRKLKRQGMRKGISDYFLPYPCKGKHGLWLEVKTKIGKATKEQAEWLADMKDLGYEAKLVNGAAEAIKAVEDYLRIG